MFLEDSARSVVVPCRTHPGRARGVSLLDPVDVKDLKEAVYEPGPV